MLTGFLTTVLGAAPVSAESLSFWAYLLDVLILLTGAMVLGALFEYLRQSAIVGYLLAGALLGPQALGLVRHEEAVSTLAELGVALLLLTIGLEFSWSQLRRMGLRALVLGTAQIGLTAVVAGGVALIWLPLSSSVAVGAMVALSSTAVVLRTLQARGDIDAVFGRTALGVLLVQDIAVVPLVLLIEGLAGEGTVGQIFGELGIDVLFGAALVGVFVVLARYVLPWMIRHPALFNNREMPILFAIVTGTGATWAAHAAGLSPALGAFVAGVVLGGSPLAMSIRADLGPLKTLFVTLFFSAIGMLAEPAWIASHLHWVLACLAAVVVGKAAIIYLLTRLMATVHRQALAAGVTLAQVGEFSFVLATAAWGREVIGESTFALIVSVTIGSLFITPYLIRYADFIGAWTERLIRPRRRRGLSVPLRRQGEEPASGQVVIVGFGPAGQAVAESLHASEQTPPMTIIDLNPRTVGSARKQGYEAFLGDAANWEVLKHARLGDARAVVVTLPDHRSAIAIIEHVRAMNPGLPVIARARYHVYVGALRIAGAQAVVDEEANVGQRLGVEVARTL